MFEAFTQLADWLSYSILNLTPDSKLGDAVHFFIEDVSKIYVLLLVMIYAIALLRASLNIERVRDYLAGKNRGIGYFLGSGFGAITPFCSSIPVFLGFISAGISVGITMSFLLTSPLINEVAILLLMSLLGWKFTLLYVVVGISIGILGGLFLDIIKAERWLHSFTAKALTDGQKKKVSSSNPLNSYQTTSKISFSKRHEFAKNVV